MCITMLINWPFNDFTMFPLNPPFNTSRFVLRLQCKKKYNTAAVYKSSPPCPNVLSALKQENLLLVFNSYSLISFMASSIVATYPEYVFVEPLYNFSQDTSISLTLFTVNSSSGLLLVFKQNTLFSLAFTS